MFFLEVFCEEQNNTIVAYLNGELDHHSAEYIRIKIDYYIDTSTSKNLVFLINLNKTIKKVIELSGISKIVKIHSDLTEVMNNA